MNKNKGGKPHSGSLMFQGSRAIGVYSLPGGKRIKEPIPETVNRDSLREFVSRRSAEMRSDPDFLEKHATRESRALTLKQQARELCNGILSKINIEKQGGPEAQTLVRLAIYDDDKLLNCLYEISQAVADGRTVKIPLKKQVICDCGKILHKNAYHSGTKMCKSCQSKSRNDKYKNDLTEMKKRINSSV